MTKNEKKVVKEVESVLKKFMFDKLDKIELEGLDAIIALRLQENNLIERCQISTKVKGDTDLLIETYVLVQWQYDKLPFTFRSVVKATR